MNNIFGKLASGLVRGYQIYISPMMPPSCRFFPTCSEYSRISFLRFGFFKGLWLTVTRILRCNPWNPGGWNPVPARPGEPDDPPEFYKSMKKKKPENREELSKFDKTS